jgi:O-methyltransferase
MAPHPLLKQAQQHYQKQEYTQAQTLYETLLQHEPHHIEAHHGLGLVFSQLKMHDQAVEQLKTTVKLAPEQVAYHYNLAEAFKRQGNPLLAKHGYIQVLERAPEFVAAHKALGGLLHQEGNARGSIFHYKEAFRLSQDADTLLALAQVYLNHQQPIFALSSLGVFIAMFGKNPTALELQAQARQIYLKHHQRSTEASAYEDIQQCYPDYNAPPLIHKYLELLKKNLTDSLHLDACAPEWSNVSEGLGWPFHAATMIGKKRLDHLHYCLYRLQKENIPGDVFEAGVWRGGATIFMRGFLKAYNNTQRKVWVADSFAGLPPQNPKHPADHGSLFHTYTVLKVSLEQVKSHFEQYQLLDAQVHFVPGYFEVTFPQLETGPLALLRLDGDMYASTFETLTHLYPRVSSGGFIIIDDWGDVSACQQAVNDYCQQHHLQPDIKQVNAACVYWRKP